MATPTQELKLHCPRCADSYVLVTAVTFNPDPRERRTVTLSVACESCDGGLVQFEFHKGETFIHAVPA